MSDDKTQQERFVEAAREAGCDEDPTALDEKLGQWLVRNARRRKSNTSKDD